MLVFWVSSISSVRFSKKLHQEGAGPSEGTKYAWILALSHAAIINPLSFQRATSFISPADSPGSMFVCASPVSASQILIMCLSVETTCRCPEPNGSVANLMSTIGESYM